MICPKCGAQNMDGVTFCGSCGAQMLSYTPSPEEPQQHVNYSQQQPPAYEAVSARNSNYEAKVSPSGNPSHNPMFSPKNYLTESIIVTIVSFCCCCSPISTILGIIAIIKANNVNSEFARGNYQVANSNSESAKKFFIWAIIVSVAFFLLWVILYVAIFAAIISEAGGLQELLNS